LIAAALVFAFFAVRWQLGDMLAELTPSSDPNISNIADVAETLAPSDPRAMWLTATAENSVFTPESIDSATSTFGERGKAFPVRFSMVDRVWTSARKGWTRA
jgi:hypothetical protein